MAKRKTTKAYKLSVTAEELQDKKYRKYIYPHEIDGIVFEDEVERKLSESSWFRCLKPQQQLLLEKEMRERAQGEFNHQILHYEDELNEPAPAIPKAVLTRLTQVLKPNVLSFFLSLIPYIHINDGLLRNQKRQLLTLKDLSILSGLEVYYLKRRLIIMQDKRLIFWQTEPLGSIKESDAFENLAELSDYHGKMISEFSAARECLIYVNPFVVFSGQYLDLYVLPYFVNSGWYVVNPYASKIKDWIEVNCK